MPAFLDFLDVLPRMLKMAEVLDLEFIGHSAHLGLHLWMDVLNDQQGKGICAGADGALDSLLHSQDLLR